MQKVFHTLICIVHKAYLIALQVVDRCLVKGFWMIINTPEYKKGLIQAKEKADNCFKQYTFQKFQLIRAHKQKKRLKKFLFEGCQGEENVIF